MNWIIYALLMFLASNIYYAFIKRIQALGVDRRVYMAANFTLPTLVFLIITLSRNLSLGLPVSFLVGIFLVALLFNTVGSILSYFAIQEAPNAGYSLVIQKGYAVYTAFAAVWLFGAELPLEKLGAVFLVIIFSGLILIDPKAKRDANPGGVRWIIFSFIAFFCFGSNSLAAKYYFEAGVHPIIYLFWVIMFTALIAWVDLIKNRTETDYRLNRLQLKNVLLMAVAVTGFYLFKQFSDVTAPNIGYSNAINTSSNAAFTLVSAYLFKDKLSMRKLIGVLGVVTGLIILML